MPQDLKFYSFSAQQVFSCSFILPFLNRFKKMFKNHPNITESKHSLACSSEIFFSTQNYGFIGPKNAKSELFALVQTGIQCEWTLALNNVFIGLEQLMCVWALETINTGIKGNPRLDVLLTKLEKHIYIFFSKEDLRAPRF